MQAREDSRPYCVAEQDYVAIRAGRDSLSGHVVRIWDRYAPTTYDLPELVVA